MMTVFCLYSFFIKAPINVESTMGAVAVCALQSLMAGPVAVLMIKSWMLIMSPAKVLSSLTTKMVSPKIYEECNGNVITQQGLSLLKNCWLYFPFANYYMMSLPNLGRSFKELSLILLQLKER